ncbi:unnamed protein product [Rotaria sp. Silwood1]|nr:unnamed protein product [Rotaria sp. Silwood1]
MNLDEIFLLPDLTLSQTFEQFEQEINEWKEKQINKIEIISNESILKVREFYQKSLNNFEQSKTKLMDEFNKLVDECSLFTNDELDMYLKRLLKNIDKLKNVKPIQLRKSEFLIDINFQPIIISEWANPFKINFSQSTVHAHTYLDYKNRMMTGQWIWDRQPDEHQKSSALKVADINGQLVSFDNRRLLAAQELHLKHVPIVRVNLEDLRPTTSMTWQKSFEIRLKQSKLPSQGTSEQPSLKYS